MSKNSRLIVLILIVLLLTQAISCNASNEKSADELAAEQALEAIYAEETAQAVVEPVPEAIVETEAVEESPETPILMPAEPPESERTLVDFDSSLRSYENRTISGDRFLDSMYERPFTSQEMVYQPDLDIISVDFANDENFFYFTINLYGMNPDEWGLNGLYGVEFDRTLTGRGDLIVLAENIQDEWTIEDVSAYFDNNGDVGGTKPIIADAGYNGNGYDTPVTLEGEMVAFARISPDDPEAVQIAVSRNLLENPAEFLWGAWADNGLRDVTKIDYNDTMGPSEAGSPINTDVDYPLKALYNLDTTCRLPFGFEQMGASYPGMCITQPPPAPKKPKGAPGQTCVTTCTGGQARPQVCTTVCN